jgi:predicted permease
MHLVSIMFELLSICLLLSFISLFLGIIFHFVFDLPERKRLASGPHEVGVHLLVLSGVTALWVLLSISFKIYPEKWWPEHLTIVSIFGLIAVACGIYAGTTLLTQVLSHKEKIRATCMQQFLSELEALRQGLTPASTSTIAWISNGKCNRVAIEIDDFIRETHRTKKIDKRRLEDLRSRAEVYK